LVKGQHGVKSKGDLPAVFLSIKNSRTGRAYHVTLAGFARRAHLKFLDPATPINGITGRRRRPTSPLISLNDVLRRTHRC